MATTLSPGTDFAALLHALPRLGAALVPLNTRLPAEQQRRQRELAGAEVLVDGPLDNGFESAFEPPGTLDPDVVHTVLFTSGTSGEPKAVELTVANHEASAAASAAVLGCGPADRWLCPLPLFHVGGLGILIRCARAAATVVVHERFDAAAVAAGLEAGEFTLASVVATQLRRLRDAGLSRAPGLRAFVLGGGPVPPDLLEWAQGAGIPIRSTYGMTETASQVAVTAPWQIAAEAVPGAELAIADGGEILVRGPMVAKRSTGSDGWLHTGDSGTVGHGGRLRVLGRLTDVIISGGENVAPAAVEAVLLAHPAIADAGVAGMPDEEWGEAVTAFVIERRPVSDYELLRFCRDHLAGYQVPKHVVRLEALPRNAAGKLMRSRLG